MSKHWIKEELKKDGLTHKTEQVVFWIKNNREKAIGAVVAFVALILLATYIKNQAETKREYGWEELAKAEQVAGKNQDQGLKMLTEFQEKFPGTTPAEYGQLYKADLLYGEGKYDEALSAYQALEQKTGDKNLKPFAIQGQAACLAAQKKYPDSVKESQRLIAAYPEHFLVPASYMFIGQVSELAGNKPEAELSYKKVTTHFTDTPWASQAKDRLNAMAGIVPPAAAPQAPAPVPQAAAQKAPPQIPKMTPQLQAQLEAYKASLAASKAAEAKKAKPAGK
ncbi:MAG: tetratricopeptide repeat protein [Elusimicrobiaceae bacterium]